jgi:beta-N-acetylhexosaminidase
MNLRRKIGQMLVMGFSGYELNKDSAVVQWLEQDGLGGVLLFDFNLPKQEYGKNLKNQQQIKQLTQQLATYAKVQGLPLFIALDYEGGAVDRLRNIEGCIKTLKPIEQALLSDIELHEEASKMAMTLKTLGFNLNFAPVVDLNLNEKEGIIGKLGRSFSNHPDEVIRASKIVVNAFDEQGIICAYKHFPGHGSATGDTHEGFVDVTEHYQSMELTPYTKLLADKNLPEPMVMTAHVVNRQLDSSGLPATLSYPILTQLLRQEIGFNGVVISDDLQMQAISNHYSLKEALRLTINAGADMVIVGNQLGSHTATEVVDCIEDLVNAGELPLSRIEEAYERIVVLKRAL